MTVANRSGRTPVGRTVLAAYALVGLVVLGLLTAGLRVAAVDASFNAQVGDQSGAVALLAIGPPSGLTVAPTSLNVALTWAPTANGSGYRVLGGSADGTGQCGNVAWSVLANTTTTAYTDNRSGPAGTSYCYQVQAALGAWTSLDGNPTSVVSLGFATSSVTLENGGTANRLDQGDRFVVRFNRAVDATTGPTSANTVCATNTGTIVLGATASSGSCVATESNRLGTLSGGAHNTNVRFQSTYTWSDAQTLVVTVGSRRSGSQGSSVGTGFTFTPAKTTTVLLSSVNRTHVCDTNTGGGSCLPRTAGSL